MFVGYYTLSATSIDISALPELTRKKLPYNILLPATLIGRLAIDKKHQGRKLGDLLIIDALKNSLMRSKDIASWAIFVEAKNKRATDFYRHYGFLALLDEPNKLYLPMKTVKTLLTASTQN